MNKKFKIQLMALTIMGISACCYNLINIKASETETIVEESFEVTEETEAATTTDVSVVVYNDSNVSISSALDRYLAYNSDSGLEVILGTAAIKKNEKPVEKAEIIENDESVQSTSYIDFSNKAIISASGQVNIRKSNDVYSDKIGIINNGGLVTVVERGTEWSHIKSGSCDGYIKNEFMVFGDDAKNYAEKNLSKVAVVNANTLRLRESDSEESNCLTLLTGGEEYGIISQGKAWTKVEVDDSLSGYVKNDYISISYRTGKAVAVAPEEKATEAPVAQPAADPAATAQVTETPATEAPATEAPVEETPLAPAPAVNPNVQSVVDYALQFVGNPYVYGGTSLTEGTDCSGFTMSVYANFGVYLPHSSRAQANCGTEVSLSEVAPGDIIFYKNGGTTIGHAALYIGGGQVVHASTEKTGIIVSNMYYSTPCKAIRVY